MPSPFRAALAKADAVIDTKLADQITVHPMLKADFGARPDPGRPAFSVVALVNYVDQSTADVGGMEARFGYEETEIEIRRALLTGRVIRKNDEIVLEDEAGKPRLKVSRIDDRDPERIGLVLTRLAGGAANVPSA